MTNLLTSVVVLIDIFTNVQYAEGYKAINPQSEVPSLEIDGRTLTQSVSKTCICSAIILSLPQLAIMEYLDETRSVRPHLLPRNDPGMRAEV